MAGNNNFRESIPLEKRWLKEKILFGILVNLNLIKHQYRNSLQVDIFGKGAGHKAICILLQEI